MLNVMGKSCVVYGMMYGHGVSESLGNRMSDANGGHDVELGLDRVSGPGPRMAGGTAL